jgi:hypothetical protein
VIVECLTAADAQQERFGVWGAVVFTPTGQTKINTTR